MGVLAALGLAACQGVTNLERIGDRAVGSANLVEAIDAYRQASSRGEGRVLAKLGNASLRAGRLQEAADAFLRVGRDDPSRRAEAADGLEAVARAAERAGDTASLRRAVIALAEVAPGRPAGRYVLSLELRGALSAADREVLGPQALAAAPDQDAADSLLVRIARDRADAGDCEGAAGLSRAVALRTALRSRAEAAWAAFAACAERVGRMKAEAGHPAEALAWLEGAIAVDSSSAAGIAAMGTLASALEALGDSTGAAIIRAVRDRKTGGQ
jgi:tetratricopeptide (TPR) repeat protein